MKAILVLENGSVYEGTACGAAGERVGDVIINTAVVGYQEMVTDAANAGKIIVLTYPLIGNYGVAKKFSESSKCQVAGLVIKEMSRMYSNWQAEGPFGEFLKKENAVAISGIDTRTLAVEIRDKGEQPGIISTKDFNKESLLKKIKNHKKEGFIKDTSVKKPVEFKAGVLKYNIGVVDLGMPRSFIRQLNTLGCNVILLPYDTPSAKIMALNLNGLIVSSGPENDPAIPDIAENVKNLLGKMPIMGISTGHHVLGLALGGKLKKMKIGHHGVNYPIKALDSFKGDITVQNHSYVLDEAGIKNRKDVNITLRNINDDSIEEMESKPLKFLSAQYCPASPGFNEVNEAFERFLNMTKSNKATKGVQHAKA